MFIARIAAIVYLCVGGGALLNKKHFKKMMHEFSHNIDVNYVGALMALIIGAVIVNAYNVWVFNWPIFITLLGWTALFKGVAHLLFPEQNMKLMKRYSKKISPEVIGACAVMIGLIFGFFGFFTI